MFERTPTYMNNTVRNHIWQTFNLRFSGQLLIGFLSNTTVETRLFAPNKYHIPCTSFLCTCWNSTSSSIIDGKPSCTSLSRSCTSHSKSTCCSVNFSWVWIWSLRVVQVNCHPLCTLPHNHLRPNQGSIHSPCWRPLSHRFSAFFSHFPQKAEFMFVGEKLSL